MGRKSRKSTEYDLHYFSILSVLYRMTNVILFVFIQGPLPYASVSSRGKEVREKGQRIIIPHYILFYSNTSFKYFGLVKQSVSRNLTWTFLDT